jgi:hypothetical protein
MVRVNIMNQWRWCLLAAAALTVGAAWAEGEERTVAGGLTLSGKQAGWRGLYPGRSTTADVNRVMGAAASVEPSEDGLTRMIYPPDANLKFNSVYVDGSGLVKIIGWANFEEEWRIPTRDLWSSLGDPKMLSRYSHVKYGSIYQWEGASVWGTVDREKNVVFSLIFYDPKDTPNIPLPQGPPEK